MSIEETFVNDVPLLPPDPDAEGLIPITPVLPVEGDDDGDQH